VCINCEYKNLQKKFVNNDNFDEIVANYIPQKQTPEHTFSHKNFFDETKGKYDAIKKFEDMIPNNKRRCSTKIEGKLSEIIQKTQKYNNKSFYKHPVHFLIGNFLKIYTLIFMFGYVLGLSGLSDIVFGKVFVCAFFSSFVTFLLNVSSIKFRESEDILECKKEINNTLKISKDFVEKKYFKTKFSN